MNRWINAGATATAVFFVASAFAVIGFGIVRATNPPVQAVKSKKLGPAEAEFEMRLRWNRLADGETEPGLHWAADDFPHPTFRGGSKEAYARFNRHLAAFVEQNFEWLLVNELFDKAVVTGIQPHPSGWFLRALVAAPRTADPETAARLRALADRLPPK